MDVINLQVSALFVMGQNHMARSQLQRIHKAGLPFPPTRALWPRAGV